MSYEMTGTMKLIMDMQTFQSGFTKREFVITTEDTYPQDIKFECVKDRCAVLDSYQVSDRVVVSFDVRGNEYNGRFYVNLQAWRLQRAENAAGGPPVEEINEMPYYEDDGINF